MSSTKPIESMAPAKAAVIMTAEPSTRPQDSAPIIVSATVSLAPEEIPSTNGPAIGLAKKVCSRKPETDSAPPSRMAAKIRGRRISHTMTALSLLCVSRICATSRTDRCKLPELTFHTNSTASSARSTANAPA